MRIYINTNQVYFTASLAPPVFAAATGVQSAFGATILTSNPIILGGGGTNPLLPSSVTFLSRLLNASCTMTSSSTLLLTLPT